MAQDATPPAHVRGDGMIRQLWRRLRVRIQGSARFGNFIASLLFAWLKLVNRTNPLVAGSDNAEIVFGSHAPAIYTFWHGQHFMAPFLPPKGVKLVAMLSRSADAELNARIVEKFGFETARGSGGRDPSRMHEKGGVRALLQLKRSLDAGKSVVMIADVSKNEVRHTGLGIVTLARLSGRPIIAAAYDSTRKHVIERSWDKTTLNLPFGRATAVASEPLFVPANTTEADMEAYRNAVDARLNAATLRAAELLETDR